MADRWNNPQNCPILYFKRCIPLVLLLLFAGMLSWAQDQGVVVYTQEGLATQELPMGGLNARHHSLPIGSRPIVRNIKTGAEIEVNIISRVPVSSDRIIDLSPSAAEALGLQSGDPVLVYFTQQPSQSVPSGTIIVQTNVPDSSQEQQPSAIVEQQPSAIVQQQAIEEPRFQETRFQEIRPEETEPAPETPQIQVIQHPPQIIRVQEPLPQLPQSLPITADQPQQQEPQHAPPQPHFPAQVPSGTNNPELNWLAWLSYMTALTQRNNNTAIQPWQMPPQPPVQQQVPPPVQQPAPQQTYQGPPPPNTIRVVPGLPDPNTGTLYHLLVGAYSSNGDASLVIQHLHGAGFSAMVEQTNNQFRVSATAIPAPYVYEAVQRLGALGFTEIWVWE